MAFVNVDTGQIIGAKIGSLGWWHEKGHIKFNDSEFGQRKIYTKESLYHIMIFFIIATLFFPIFKWCAFSAWVGVLYYAVYEEIWCWRYAYGKKPKQRF